MWVVVLNDGETFTSLQGCRALDIPASVDDDDVDEYVKAHFHEGVAIERVMREINSCRMLDMVFEPDEEN